MAPEPALNGLPAARAAGLHTPFEPRPASAGRGFSFSRKPIAL